MSPVHKLATPCISAMVLASSRKPPHANHLFARFSSEGNVDIFSPDSSTTASLSALDQHDGKATAVGSFNDAIALDPRTSTPYIIGAIGSF